MRYVNIVIIFLFFLKKLSKNLKEKIHSCYCFTAHLGLRYQSIVSEEITCHTEISNFFCQEIKSGNIKAIDKYFFLTFSFIFFKNTSKKKILKIC